VFGFQIIWPFYQRRIRFAPISWCDSIDAEWTHRDPDKTQRWKSDSRRHPSDLAVPAFGDYQLNPRGRNQPSKTNGRSPWPQFGFRETPNPGGTGATIAQCHTTAEAFESFSCHDTFNLCPVGLGELVPWTRETMLELAVVRQQQQSLGIVIEATGRMYRRIGNVLGKC